MDERSGYLRIGELARRTGVSPELLRAWESRYALLEPSRSAGGFRLYSDRDEERVRTVTRLISEGLSAGEAARLALRQPSPVTRGNGTADAGSLVSRLLDELTEAIGAFDAQRANEVLDRAFSSLTVESALRDVVLAYLRALGHRWAGGEASIAEEHMASNLIRGRLLGLARGWGSATGPGIVVACPPGEWHDLGAIAFGIVAAQRGHRITFLGANSPYATIADAVRAVRPELVVLAVTDPRRARLEVGPIRELAASTRVALGGVTDARAGALGAERLAGDPVTAAMRLRA